MGIFKCIFELRSYGYELVVAIDIHAYLLVVVRGIFVLMSATPVSFVASITYESLKISLVCKSSYDLTFHYYYYIQLSTYEYF
jgi:hypothetical protein